MIVIWLCTQETISPIVCDEQSDTENDVTFMNYITHNSIKQLGYMFNVVFY